MGKQPHIGVVGGSFAGLASTLAIRKVLPNARVTVIEPRDMSQPFGAAIGLQINGVKALRAINHAAYEQVAANAIGYFDTIRHDRQGNRLGVTPMQGVMDEYQRQTWGISSVMTSWFALHTVLRRQLTEDVKLVRGTVMGASVGDDLVTVEYSLEKPGQPVGNGGEDMESGKEVAFDLLIAADGGASTVRQLLYSDQTMFPNYREVINLWCRISEADVKFYAPRLTNNYEISGDGVSQLFLRVEEDTFVLGSTDTVAHMEEEGVIFDLASKQLTSATTGDAISKRELLMKRVGTQPPELQQYFDAISEDSILLREMYSHNGDTWTPASYGSGRVVIIGDAAHTLRPRGQGSSQAFEDAYWLGRLLAESGVQSGLGPQLGAIREDRVHYCLQLDRLELSQWLKEQQARYPDKERHELLQLPYLYDSDFEPLQARIAQLPLDHAVGI